MSNHKSPRILMVLSSFPKLSESFIVNKFLGFLQKGWDVHVVCAESNPSEWKNFPELDSSPQAHRRVRVSWIHRPRWLAFTLMPVSLIRSLLSAPQAALRYLLFGWKMFGFDILRHLYLDAEIILLNPDLIHFEFGSLAPERMYLKELLGCKMMVSFRGYDLNFTEVNKFEYYKDVWAKSDALHFLSEHLWQVAQERGCPADKFVVLIPPAVDTDFFNPQRIEINMTMNEKLRILSVGRLEWKKGYEYALQAVNLLEHQNIPFEYYIIGAGPYLEAISFARHQLNLKDKVTLLGAQPLDVVRAEMEKADIFLHPSLSEGFCNVVMEAQAMCLPVVASDAGGLKENIDDTVTGFIVARRNPQLMAEKMALLANSLQLRKKMGEAGRQRVLKHFQAEDQIRKFEEVYSRTLNNP